MCIWGSGNNFADLVWPGKDENNMTYQLFPVWAANNKLTWLTTVLPELFFFSFCSGYGNYF